MVRYVPETRPHDAPQGRCRPSCCKTPIYCARGYACACHTEGKPMIGPRLPKLTAAQERAAYDAVTRRDQGRCVRCGQAGDVERDHRQNRDAWNTVPSNLQLLGGPFGCGCHLWKTEHPEEAEESGFKVPRWARPDVWPAYRFGEGWVIYLDTPTDGAWWQPITSSTAELIMTSGGR